MTKNEALAFLNASEQDDLNEAVEEHFFEIKKYIISKPAISKLFDSQFKKLDRLIEIVQLLNLNYAGIEYSKLPEIEFSEIIIDSFQAYENHKSRLKSLIMNADSLNELKVYAKELLNLQEKYTSLWPAKHINNLNPPILSNEADPIQLLIEIKEMSGNGITTFSELRNNTIDTWVTVSNEMKRLSLLREKEQEWKTSSKN